MTAIVEAEPGEFDRIDILVSKGVPPEYWDGHIDITVTSPRKEQPQA